MKTRDRRASFHLNSAVQEIFPGGSVSDDAHRIRTTHVGSLPRPVPLLDALAARQRGEPVADEVLESATRDAVAGIVAAQREHGIDVVTDGEMGKLGFFSYVTERLRGIERPPRAEYVYSLGG